jgi:hypothetical protein
MFFDRFYRRSFPPVAMGLRLVELQINLDVE